LSWSLLEAMSAGCLVIGSDTAPVREVIDGSNGLLVPFFDVDLLAQRAIDALARPQDFRSLRKAARDTVVERYDLKRICLPGMRELLGIEAGADVGRDPAEQDTRKSMTPAVQYRERA